MRAAVADVQQAHQELTEARTDAQHKVSSLLGGGWSGVAADAFAEAWQRLADRRRPGRGRPRRDVAAARRRAPRHDPAATTPRRPPSTSSRRRTHRPARLMAGSPDQYAVDPEQLDAIVHDLETTQQTARRPPPTTSRSRSPSCTTTWEGLSAAAQREAHQEWEAGMATMQDGARGHAARGPGRAHQLHQRRPGQRLHVAGPGVTIAVDAGGFDSAAEAFAMGNGVAAQFYSGMKEALSGYGQMAGDDKTSDEFAAQYDAAAADTMGAARRPGRRARRRWPGSPRPPAPTTATPTRARSTAPTRPSTPATSSTRRRRPRSPSRRTPHRARSAATTRTPRSSGTCSPTTSRATPGPAPTPARCAQAAGTWRQFGSMMDNTISSYLSTAISQLQAQRSPEVEIAIQVTKGLQARARAVLLPLQRPRPGLRGLRRRRSRRSATSSRAS